MPKTAKRIRSLLIFRHSLIIWKRNIQGLLYCNKLFEYERSYREKGLSFKHIYNRRLKDQKLVIEAFLSWLDQLHPKNGDRLIRAINRRWTWTARPMEPSCSRKMYKNGVKHSHVWHPGAGCQILFMEYTPKLCAYGAFTKISAKASVKVPKAKKKAYQKFSYKKGLPKTAKIK